MDFFAGISGINNAITIAKALKQIEKDYDAATLKAQVADLISALADAKMALTDASEENKRLASENERLLQAGSEVATLVEIESYRYRTNGTGQAIGYPACPACLDKEKRVVLLIQEGYAKDAKCPRCASKFYPVESFTQNGCKKKNGGSAIIFDTEYDPFAGLK